MKRHLSAAAAIGLTTALIGGSPPATARPADTTEVSARRIDSLLVSEDELSRGFGIEMQEAGSGDRPDPPWELDKAECREVFGPSSDAFGSSYDAARITATIDTEEPPSLIVIQTVGVYPDSDAAQQAFTEGYPSSLRDRCNNAVVHVAEAPSEVDWGLKVVRVTGDHAQARAFQLYNNEWGGWNCSLDARVAGNVFAGVQVCSFGNGLKNAGVIMDRITNRVAGG